LTVTDYTARLKTLADRLRDLGQPVSEPSQVLNLLHGLHPKYRDIKPVITSKFPPHTCMSARSYLLLEELCDKHDSAAEAGQAYNAGHNSFPSTGTIENSGGSGSYRNKPRHKKRGSSSTSGSSGSGSRGGNGKTGQTGGGQQQQGPPSGQPWAASYNPWTGLVQAWPMPFHAPGAGVLGPRLPFQPQ
jgi:hypothetical protein